jgi:hypothetical protein
MQRGSLALVSRKAGPDVWQFRWSEKDLHGVRAQRKRVIRAVFALSGPGCGPYRDAPYVPIVPGQHANRKPTHYQVYGFTALDSN